LRLVQARIVTDDVQTLARFYEQLTETSGPLNE
jgi:hypothetical protein